MRIVQFEIPGEGRRVGVVEGDVVLDVTSADSVVTRVYDAFCAAQRSGRRLAEFLAELLASGSATSLPYGELLSAGPGGTRPFLHPPLDHDDPHRVLVSGTGLTHTGGMKSRDQMHAEKAGAEQQGTTKPAGQAVAPEMPQTDSARMFAMGMEGGKPAAGERGVAPEWFYKGNGTNLRGPGATLEIPAFARDGGEEPELVGCYIIDEHGTPRRLGFALGNEWSDHATERINYLYLAPSKLRTCAVGPELNTDCDFREVRLRCTVSRGGEAIYDSGELFSGEEYMCHSLANCEDHHFKYPQHRRPGDVHLHFFGTSKLSFSTREWKYQPADVVRIESAELGAALVNRVVAGDAAMSMPIRVEPA